MAGLSSAPKAQWSSRFAFIMAAVGSSVGLGNLWRFSAEAGANGGGAFILIYLCCVFFIGIPVLMSEYLIGRSGQANSAVISVEDVASRSGRSKVWASSAWVGMIASFLIVSFYCVVAAWVMAYIPKFLMGSFDGQTPEQIADMFGGKEGLINSPMEVLPWFIAFAVITIWLVSRGVNDGIEFAAKILMPIFFVMLICLALYGFITGLKTGGTQQAIAFLFTPDFDKISFDVAARALGQACFSLGIGSAIMITYGSYLSKDVSIPRSAILVGSVDTIVALIAGFAIFPIMFTYGLNPSAGAGIFFISLPTALSNVAGGNLIGASFFFLAIFAAVTSSISLFEPAVSWVAEKFKISRVKSAWAMGGLMIALGIISVMSMEFLDWVDTGLTGPIMLPLSALLVVIFTGWRMNKALINEQFSDKDAALGNILLFMTRYIAIPFVFVVLLFSIAEKYFPALLGG